jgi:phage-related protein
MTNLKSVLTGLRNTALTPLIKDLTPLIEQTSEWIKQNKELIALKIQETFDTIKRTVDALIRAWDSGLIPAIIAGVAAFKTLLPIAMGISKLTGAITTAKGAMAGLNLVMAANPVGAVVAVIAGLVGVITLLWNRSEKFRNTIKGAWEILKQVATAGPRLIGKVAGFLGFGGSGGQATSANAGQNQRTVTENRSQLDVNLAGLPQGSTVRQRGNAPGIGVNYGFAQGGL